MFEFINSIRSVYNNLTASPAFDFEVFGNSVELIVWAGLSFIALFAVFGLVQKIVLTRLARLAKKTKTDIDDTLINIVKSVRPSFYFFVAFYLSVKVLKLHPVVDRAFAVILLIWVIYQVIKIFGVLIDVGTQKYLKKQGDEASENAVHLVGKFLKALVWLFAGLTLLSNLGINITSLVAGLGIGGLAVAFAVQNLLEDLFSSFAIYFDKPFQIGDYIVVGEESGVVERVGIKTTRLRALGGEELVISNKELTSTRVQNFKQMEERRVLFKFGILYETPDKLIKEVPGMVEEIIKKVDKVRFDRAHFLSFDDSALGFEVVYYVDSREYIDYVDAQQKINLQIREQFTKNGIEMAYPTRTVYLAGGDAEKS